MLRRSAYAIWEASRSDLLRTAWGCRGGGGRGRLKELGIGIEVLAYEYVGDAGTGGRLLGEGGWLVVAISVWLLVFKKGECLCLF